MKALFPFAIVLMIGSWLLEGQAFAQMTEDHYLAGTEGIKAGSLPAPGIYFEDINWYEHLIGTESTGQRVQMATYVNEPRIRWITPETLLGANYGVEIMLPWVYQKKAVSDYISFALPSGPFGGRPMQVPGYRYSKCEINDLEISPLLLSWHWQHFDVRAGYAVWIPTGGNSFIAAGNTVLNPSAYVPPPQFHWWEHMITVGGTWYPDAAKKWALSDLNHYEINQPFNTVAGAMSYGQHFTTEWGFSRTLGKYLELGFIGNYARQTTSSREHDHYSTATTYSDGSILEVGPEIKASVPQFKISASFRYLRELNDPDFGSGNDPGNGLVLTLSKWF